MNVSYMKTLSHFIRDLSIPESGDLWGVTGITSLSFSFSMKSFSALSLPRWSHLALLLFSVSFCRHTQCALDHEGPRLLLSPISPAFSSIQPLIS